MNSQQERKHHRMVMRKLGTVLKTIETEIGRMIKDENKTEFQEIMEGLRMVVTEKRPQRNPSVEHFQLDP